MNAWRVGTLGVLVLVIAGGCSKLPMGGNKAGSGNGNAAADPAAAADEKLATKLDEYLTGCLNNSARQQFRNSADDYLEKFDDKKAPTPAVVPNLRKVADKDVNECIQSATKAKAMQPALPELDDAVAEFATAIKAGTPVLNDAQAYYDQKNYLDDKMAKGQALHPQLLAAFRQFDTVSHGVSEAFAKQKGPLDSRELERLKNKGPKLAYLTKRSIMNVDAFEKALNVKSVKEFFAQSPTELQSKIDVLVQDQSELQKIVDAKGKELEGTFNVDHYTEKLDEFVKVAKGITRRIRDQKKFTDSELERLGTQAGWMTEDSPDKLDLVHTSLINYYNNLRL